MLGATLFGVSIASYWLLLENLCFFWTVVVVALKEEATVLAAQVYATFFTLDVEIYGCGLLI